MLDDIFVFQLYSERTLGIDPVGVIPELVWIGTE